MSETWIYQSETNIVFGCLTTKNTRKNERTKKYNEEEFPIFCTLTSEK